VNYNELTKNPQPDVFLTGFNTPKFVTNLSFGNREIVKNFGFNVVWRWQDQVYWESTLANGQVPAYSTIDAQVSLAVPALKSKVKIGATNLFNQRYYQFAAGPTIGGLYYVAITYDGTVVR
ncbi:MAG: energy transducer TonB, partial [Saprospiraceae bacterium]